MVRDYKKDILSVDAFLDNRPDMAVHSEQSIQSAIYSAASLLNGETNGNIEVIWDYNKSSSRVDTDPRYRSDYELGQIVEAFIVQTQYTLNIGNDFSVGGGSYSIGNINSSFSRPIDRDIIAPGVVRLLQNARVYQAQSYFSEVQTNKCDSDFDCCYPINYDDECISRNIGDHRYVKQEQGIPLKGLIARISESGFVTWVKPSEIGVPEDLAKQLDSLRLGVSINKQAIETNKQNISKNEQRLNQVENVSNANKSEITTLKTNVNKNTGDITQIRNQHAEDTTEINNRFGNIEIKVNDIIDKLKEGKFVHIEGDDTQWDAQHSYSIGALVTHNGKIWLSKINNNLGNEPSLESQQWELFSEVDIDLTKYPTKQEVLEMLDDYLKLSDFEARLKSYYTKSDIDAKFNEKANVSDLDSYVKKDAFNTSQQQQDDKISDLQQQITAIVTGKVEGVKVATFNIKATISEKDSVGVDYNELDARYARLDNENEFTQNQYLLNRKRLNFATTNKNNLVGRIYPGANNNSLYVEVNNGDLVLAGNTVSVNNKKITNLATPTSDNEAATKAYVDSKTPNLTQYAKLNESNSFTTSQHFKSGANIWSMTGLNYRDNKGNISLNVFPNSQRDGVTNFQQFDNTGASYTYKLRYGGPTDPYDLTHKTYVDNKATKRKSFKLSQFTKFYDGAFQGHNNWWGGVWRMSNGVLGIPSGYRIVSVTFDMSVDYSQPWYRQSMFNWWWDTAGYLVVKVIKIYDSNSDFAYWGNNVTVNIEYAKN